MGMLLTGSREVYRGRRRRRGEGGGAELVLTYGIFIGDLRVQRGLI